MIEKPPLGEVPVLSPKGYCEEGGQGHQRCPKCVLYCPSCSRNVPAGVADYGRLWSWYCTADDGGCGRLIAEQPRTDDASYKTEA